MSRVPKILLLSMCLFPSAGYVFPANAFVDEVGPPEETIECIEIVVEECTTAIIPRTCRSGGCITTFNPPKCAIPNALRLKDNAWDSTKLVAEGFKNTNLTEFVYCAEERTCAPTCYPDRVGFWFNWICLPQSTEEFWFDHGASFPKLTGVGTCPE